MRVSIRPTHKDGATQSTHRQQIDAVDPAEEQRAGEPAEKAAVGDESALPQPQHLERIGELIEVGEDVEQRERRERYVRHTQARSKAAG